MTLLELNGKALEPCLDDLGALRIAVFREYPYLYDGSPDYEREYLKCYVNCERSMVALVLDEDRVVGATTETNPSLLPRSRMTARSPHGSQAAVLQRSIPEVCSPLLGIR